MTPRLVKHLIYSFFYLLAMAVIFWLIYIFFLKPAPTCFDKIKNQGETGIDCGGPCPSCELAELKPLAVKEVMALPARENEISLLAGIANPNPNFGVQTFSYKFQVFGPFNALLETVEGQSFIYPGEEKYLIEPSLKINLQDVSRVKLSINEEEIVWQSKEKMDKSNLDILSRQTIISNGTVTVKGIIQNKNPLLIPQIKIIAILYNLQRNQILNASYTTLNDLEGEEQQNFSIEFPKGDWIKKLDLNRTKIFIEPRTEIIKTLNPKH